LVTQSLLKSVYVVVVWKPNASLFQSTHLSDVTTV
jgi:hypothetical protein